MGQNALDQSDCRILKSTISLEQNHEKACFFLHIDTNLWKLKVNLKIQGWAWSKWVVSQEGIIGIN